MLNKRAVLVKVLLQNGRPELPKTLLLFRSQITTTFFVNSISSKTPTVDEQSFVVSYLISSCGLSPETALSVSRKVYFGSAEKPDSVLALLRNHGFTNTHISKLTMNHPKVLVTNPKKTLFPKLEFFHSIGIPAATLVSNPNLLQFSLHKSVIPVYNYLKSVLLLDDKQVTKTFNSNTRIFGKVLEKNIIPRIEVLRGLGVPASSLSFLVTYYSYVLVQNHKRFHKTLKEVVEMGLDPSRLTFICVLQLLIRTSKSTWDRKMEVYRKCGWSEDDLKLALKKWPLFMSLSEKKITRVMDLFVNLMGWKPSDIARIPTVLQYSLKTRTIPRCLVVKLLILKGLICKDVSFSSIIITKDEYFLEKFVTKYLEDVPQLLDVFNGKVGLAKLGFESEEICGKKLL